MDNYNSFMGNFLCYLLYNKFYHKKASRIKNKSSRRMKKVKSKKQNSKIVCEKCKKTKRSRHIIYFKGKYLCKNCISVIGNVGFLCNQISFEEALNKIYEVKGYKQKTRATIMATCTFPSILVGHKFKIMLQDKKLKKENSI